MYIYDNSKKNKNDFFFSIHLHNLKALHGWKFGQRCKGKRFFHQKKIFIILINFPTAKKSYRYIIAALLTIMGIAAPLAMKAVGLIAYKALVISSVALTIAGIIALKKIYSSDHHHDETTFHVASGDHRRTAYILRPVHHGPNNSNGQPQQQQSQDSQNDPYRYYYDYPTQQAP